MVQSVKNLLIMRENMFVSATINKIEKMRVRWYSTHRVFNDNRGFHTGPVFNFLFNFIIAELDLTEFVDI